MIVKYFGPPGTGKTTKLRSLVEEDVKKRDMELPRIGYVSFTKGAAEVIRERMHASVEDVKWFRTIHSACMTLAGIGRESVIVAADYRRFREQTGMEIRADDEWDTENYEPLDFTPTKRAMELSIATDRPIQDVIRELPPHVNLTMPRVELFIEKWYAFKRETGKFDFTDMLKRYMADPIPMPVDKLYLDEAQDLSAFQWRVFHELSRGVKDIVMAGDDDQAIYGFIGGSEYGFLDHPADEEHVLRRSWRVPRAIGEAADAIISKVQHRKSKDVLWKDAAGELSRMNLDAFTLPWRQFMSRFKEILVLTRHRRGAKDFSDDLKSLGVPHDINGEGLGSWKEAKLATTFLTLAEGGSATLKRTNALLVELGLKEVQGRGRQKFNKDTIGHKIEWDGHWVSLLSRGDRHKIRRYEAIRQLVDHDGVAALTKKPPIRVSTMHAAKGAEADLVIIVPDCTTIVRRNILTPAEVRLAYVAMTRAKKQCVVLTPRSDCFITHFFGG
jgi:superfamily I DNA/RNA helicase